MKTPAESLKGSAGVFLGHGWRRILDWVGLLFLVGVWGFAGWAKWGEVEVLRQDVLNYAFVGETLAGWVALILPPLELALALGLLLPWTRRWAALVSGVLVVLFAWVTLYAWGRGIDLSCGCFGEAAAPERPWEHVLLWLAMLGCSGWLWVGQGEGGSGGE